MRSSVAWDGRMSAKVTQVYSGTLNIGYVAGEFNGLLVHRVQVCEMLSRQHRREDKPKDRGVRWRNREYQIQR